MTSTEAISSIASVFVSFLKEMHLTIYLKERLDGIFTAHNVIVLMSSPIMIVIVAVLVFSLTFHPFLMILSR